jgi:putative RNA 2'-phosphotransferase
MDSKTRTQLSKFLSLVLRHEPQAIGISLDPSGWVEVDTLLTAMAKHGKRVTMDQLQTVVATNEKNRFTFSEDGQRIRASQGHSVEIDLGYQPATPPEVLYHGTVAKFLPSIREIGLIKRERHHVHLSMNQLTAEAVGQRRGKPVVLKIRAGEMHRDGILFYLSANGVWLTDHVPAKYLDLPSS